MPTYKNSILISFAIILFMQFQACLIAQSTDSSDESHTHVPEARWGQVFIYNPAQDHILLFGGTSKGRGEYLDDTWILENEKWRKLEVLGPTARGFSAATYHDERKTIIIHGGRANDGESCSDMWEWNGNTWTQLESESLYASDHHQMVYIPDENIMLAFGGWNGKEVLSSTWRWDEYWEKMDITSPPKRSAFGMAYNQDVKAVHLYGGLWINGQYADCWSWYDGQWRAISGPYDNSSLDHHALIFDNKLKKTIGFGGKNYRYRAQENTFSIEDGKIIYVNDQGPSSRHSFGFTYDSNQEKAYLFGGKYYENGKQVALKDLWTWNGSVWTELQ